MPKSNRRTAQSIKKLIHSTTPNAMTRPLNLFLKCHAFKTPEMLGHFLGYFAVALYFHLDALQHYGLLDLELLTSTPDYLRGFASAFLCAGGITLLCFLILRIRVLSWLMAVIWCYFSAGNYDYIEALNINMSILVLKTGLQPEFIYGSAFSPRVLQTTAMALGLWCGVTLASWYALSKLYRFRHIYRYLIMLPCFALSIASLTFSIIYLPSNRDWYKYHLLEYNIHELISVPQALPMVDVKILSQYVAPDLSGKPVYTTPPPSKPNILLVTIEGLSANALDVGWLPYLKKRTSKGLYYRNFIVSSTRTGNGMYALLCGDFPRFTNTIKTIRGGGSAVADTVSKLSRMPKHAHCMPQMLRDKGYITTYIQATNLNFDGQNMLTSRTGFEEIYDYTSFTKPYEKNWIWGPNDQAFFQRLKQEVKKKQTQERPWLITGLSVGTHHPYSLPKNVFKDIKNPQMASFMYADLQLEHLLNDMETNGSLKNTLVIITSDESLYRNAGARYLTENRGFLFILTPDKQHAIIKAPFMQSDIYASIADYVGDDATHIPTGRSVFRTYDTFHPLFFGSIYDQRIEGLLEQDYMISCSNLDYNSCSKYKINGNDLFYSTRQKTTITPEEAHHFLSIAGTLHHTVLAKPYKPQATTE
jgi:hypothetical protein